MSREIKRQCSGIATNNNLSEELFMQYSAKNYAVQTAAIDPFVLNWYLRAGGNNSKLIFEESSKSEYI